MLHFEFTSNDEGVLVDGTTKLPFVYIYWPSYMTVADFISACKKDLQS